MRVRALHASDVPALQQIAESSGFPYPKLFSADAITAMRVVVDDHNRPLMAAAAVPLVEIYLWCGPIERPHARLHALRLLHDAMIECLKQKGFHSAEAFLPPSLAERFARRLVKSFGWKPNWASWNRAF